MASRLKRSSSRPARTLVDVSVAALAGPLEAVRRRDGTHAVLLVDIDRFHVLNNGLGRSLGDAVLAAVADRLEQCVAEIGQFLFCSGDRFIVVVPNAGDGSKFDAIARRLIEAVRVPIPVAGGGSPIVVTASVGSALDDGAAVDEIVRRADIALSVAKSRGLSSYASFEPEMRQAAEGTVRFERDLREALDAEHFFLSYLPGVDITTGRVTSAEALLRWNHPQRGVISARDFLPVLEQSGTIVEIGTWVLHEACMQAAAWQRRGMSLEMHVNLSERQLAADVLLDDLRDSLSTSRLDPALLVLEVAESIVLKDAVAVTERLNEFKALGVSIAMDSFGAAFAALQHLKQLPLDIVELDRSLVAEIGRDDSAAALVGTLVQIARNLGLMTLAVGVEDNAQLTRLRDAGCGGALGHLYSEPVDAEALDQVFKDFEPDDRTGWREMPEGMQGEEEGLGEDEDGEEDELGDTP